MTDTVPTKTRGRLKPEFMIKRQGKDFCLYAGLLDLAHQEGLCWIDTTLIQFGSEENGATWIFRATVKTNFGTFTGFGDANPTNVSRQMLTVLPRMAETRSKARALRDAVNVGMAAMEELGPDGAVGDDEPEDRPMNRAPEPEQARQPRSQTQAQDGITRSNDGAEASERQINACYGIGKSMGWSSDKTSGTVKQRWGFIPEELSSKQASEVITWLNSQKNQ